MKKISLLLVAVVFTAIPAFSQKSFEFRVKKKDLKKVSAFLDDEREFHLLHEGWSIEEEYAGYYNQGATYYYEEIVDSVLVLKDRMTHVRYPESTEIRHLPNEEAPPQSPTTITLSRDGTVTVEGNVLKNFKYSLAGCPTKNKPYIKLDLRVVRKKG